MRRTRAKSVLEVFEEDCCLKSCRLSERDDVYPVLGLRVGDGYRDALEKAQSHKALFLVTEAIILLGERGAIEYPFGVHEVETVVRQVPLALRLVPREPHGLVYRHSVYTSSGRDAAV